MDEMIKDQSRSLTRLLSKVMRRLFTLQSDQPAMELPLAQLRVCNCLYCRPRSMSEVGKKLGISLSAVTQIADRLERSGMVERLPEAEDRRSKSLQLTPQGMEVMRLRRETRLQQAETALEKLTEMERVAVLDALQVLLGVCAEDPGELPEDSTFIAQI